MSKKVMSKKNSRRSRKSGRGTAPASQQKSPAAAVEDEASLTRRERPAEKLTLALHEDYQVTYHPAKDPKDPLIITFAGQPGAMAAQGFGTSFCLKENYDSIYVAQRYESHFQGLSLEDFQRIIRPFTADRPVICYGSSLGAYAALYYGGTVDARILAGAPMLPSWPSLNNPRYKDFELRHLPLTDVPHSTVQPTVLYDPYSPADKKFLGETVRRAYPDAVFVEYPYAGHTVLQTLHQADLLRDVVLSYFETGVVAEFDMPTDGFVPYHVNYGTKLMRDGNVTEAVQHARRAFDIQRVGSAISLLIRALSRSDDEASLLHLVDHELSGEERVVFVDQVKILHDLVEKARG